eukprot:6203111-Pleurochrysis_carterae.AAC.2
MPACALANVNGLKRKFPASRACRRSLKRPNALESVHISSFPTRATVAHALCRLNSNNDEMRFLTILDTIRDLKSEPVQTIQDERLLRVGGRIRPDSSSAGSNLNTYND